MTARRIVYLVCLAAAAFFYIFDTHYFSFALLLLGLGFLPLELLVSLPGLLAARASLAAAPAEIVQGQPLVLTVNATALRPLCSVKAVLVCRNLFDRSETKQRLRLPMGRPAAFEVERYGEGCGALRFSLRRCRVLDVAGLFTFPLHPPTPVMVLARPAPPLLPPPMPPAALDQSLLPDNAPRPGPEALREFTDIREYRMGDSLRDVHWKLTAKFGDLMVREGSHSAYASPQLCFDLWGKPATVCATLARLESLSRTLWEMERRHTIHWLDRDGALHSALITSQLEFESLLWSFLETPLPRWGKNIDRNLPPLPGPVLVVEADSLTLYENGHLKEVVE